VKPLVVLCISDSSAAVRLSILSAFSGIAANVGRVDISLQTQQQAHLETLLCQSELLSSLALCLNDEAFVIRERVLALLSSLALRNPTHLLPLLRSFLIQLLHSLQHQPDDTDDVSASNMHALMQTPIDTLILEADDIDTVGPILQSHMPLSPIPLSEQNAKLLLTFISYPGGEKLCRTHTHAILQVLLPKLTHILTMHTSARRAQPALLSSLSTAASAALSSLPRSSQLASYILSTVGKLSVLAGADMRPSIALLLQLIIDTLQEQASGAAATPDDEETLLKRTVAIRTLGQLIISTGNVIEPYMLYPSLLPTLLRLLQDERTSNTNRGIELIRSRRPGLIDVENDSGNNSAANTLLSALPQSTLSSYFLTSTSQREFRLELLKLLAKIGALNPYRFRQSPTMAALLRADAHHQPSLTGAPPAATTPGLGSEHFLDAEPQLCDLMAQAEQDGIDTQTILHEEYFPSVSLRALLRILLNPRLSHLHILVLRAVLFIFRSLGSAKSAQYLPSVTPFILNEMSSLATQSMSIPAVATAPVGQLFNSSPASNLRTKPSTPLPPTSPTHHHHRMDVTNASDIVQLQQGYLQHVTAITQIVTFHMRPYLPRLFDILFVGHSVDGSGGGNTSASIQLPYWSEPALTPSILRLIEVIALSQRTGGGEEDFKTKYQPTIMGKLLQLIQHADQNLAVTSDPTASSVTSNNSSARHSTHLHPAHATHVLLLKVLHTVQILGSSSRDAVSEFLHTLLPTLIRVLERCLQQLPKEQPQSTSRRSSTSTANRTLQTHPTASTEYKLSVSVVQTISVLAQLHDCSLHASLLISCMCRFFKSTNLSPSSLTEGCMELLCILMHQLGFDFLLFYHRSLEVAMQPLAARYAAIAASDGNNSSFFNFSTLRSPMLHGTPLPQGNLPHARSAVSISSGEASPATITPSSGRGTSAAQNSVSPLLESNMPMNHFQRFHFMLTQLKQRVEEVRKQNMLVPSNGGTHGKGKDVSNGVLDLSLKDFYHVSLFPPMEHNVQLEGSGLFSDNYEDDPLASLNMSVSNRNASFTDLASLSEHGDGDDASVDGDSVHHAAPKKLRMSAQSLARAWNCQARSTREDYLVWMKGFGLELLKESPSPALRACSFLALKYPPLASTLFNAAFLAAWPELSDSAQDDLISNLEFLFVRSAGQTRPQNGNAVVPIPHRHSPAPSLQSTPTRNNSTSPNGIERRRHSPSSSTSSSAIPSSVIATLLNLIEFMEHMESTLPISISLLSTLSVRCHALATALHYQEAEFQQTNAATQLAAIAAAPTNVNLGGDGDAASVRQAERIIESLISINNKLGQKASADGILKLVLSQQQSLHHRAQIENIGHADQSSNPVRKKVLLKPSWLEKLQRWEDALEAYEERQEELMHSVTNIITSAPLPDTSAVVNSPASPPLDNDVNTDFIETQLGKMRCLRALGEWDQLATVAQNVWNRTDDVSSSNQIPMICYTGMDQFSLFVLLPFSLCLFPG
jgi:hypothetical protein